MYILDNEDKLGSNDTAFWHPLVLLPAMQELTFGQMVHTLFPNMKYIIRFTARCAKKDQALRESPWVYISDHNLIEQQDTTALRKMVFEILREYDYAKRYASARGCIELGKNLQFHVDSTNQPDFGALCDSVKSLYAEFETEPDAKDTKKHTSWNTLTKCRLFYEFQPFRTVAILAFDGPIFVRLDLLTNTRFEDMKIGIKKKILDIFWLMRRALKQDMGDRWTMKMDVDLKSSRKAAVAPLLERTSGWLKEVGQIHQDVLCSTHLHLLDGMLSTHQPSGHKRPASAAIQPVHTTSQTDEFDRIQTAYCGTIRRNAKDPRRIDGCLRCRSCTSNLYRGASNHSDPQSQPGGVCQGELFRRRRNADHLHWKVHYFRPKPHRHTFLTSRRRYGDLSGTK